MKKIIIVIIVVHALANARRIREKCITTRQNGGIMEGNNMYTIRKCIKEMRKVGTNKICLNNGTKIYLLEMNADKAEEIGTSKRNSDGTIRVMRRIFCSIQPSKNARMMEELKNNWWLYNPKKDYWENYFHEDEFLLPERILNQFISANMGIDYYDTISRPYYMMADTMSMMDW